MWWCFWAHDTFSLSLFFSFFFFKLHRLLRGNVSILSYALHSLVWCCCRSFMLLATHFIHNGSVRKRAIECPLYLKSHFLVIFLRSITYTLVFVCPPLHRNISHNILRQWLCTETKRFATIKASFSSRLNGFSPLVERHHMHWLSFNTASLTSLEQQSCFVALHGDLKRSNFIDVCGI